MSESVNQLETLKVVADNEFVKVDGTTISFTIQDGPVKEHGVNGCQVDVLIEAGRQMIEKFNAACPSEWNEKAMGNLVEALKCLAERTAEREAAGVEGTDEPVPEAESAPAESDGVDKQGPTEGGE